MSLQKVLCDARECFDSPPLNESTTCEWVIYPLLLGMGYARKEIHSRLADNNGQYPDYTILPDSPRCWYLEAKAWSTPLQDTHAQQSLNYANHNGRRWVVLSNGQEWRLYDNAIQGVASEKLSARASLADSPAIEKLLLAIGKESVLTDGLERFAKQERLSRWFSDESSRRDSELVATAWKLIQKHPGLGLYSFSRDQVVAVLQGGTAPVQPAGKMNSPTKTDVKPARKARSDGDSEQDGAFSLALELPRLKKLVTRRRPFEIEYPDGSVQRPGTWRELTMSATSWVIGRHGSPALPFRVRRGHCYFLNTEPEHEDHRMLTWDHLEAEGRTIYVDVHQSAASSLQALKVLCEDRKVDLSKVKIQISNERTIR